MLACDLEGIQRGVHNPHISPTRFGILQALSAAGYSDHVAECGQDQAGHLSRGQLKVMAAIEQCRTASLGGHVERCPECSHTRIAYNSCRNRHCPKCQGAVAKQWLAAREADLLEVEYYHVVFTLPAPIGQIAYTKKAVVYGLLFAAAAETLLTIAADPKHLGARIGLTAVLHTWGSALTHHPHLHCIVPGGGIALDGQRWVACRRGFFLPVRVLSRLFRRLFCDKLAAAHQAGELQFFAEHAALAQADAFAAWLRPLRRSDWVVYAKRPFAGPQAVLAYLSRYTHRVAIANSRLITVDDHGVTFKWKDYRAKGGCRYGHMTLRSRSSCAASCCMCCHTASTVSATMGCWPMPRGSRTWHGPGPCCRPSHRRCWLSPSGTPMSPWFLPAPSIGIAVHAAAHSWW
jgi:hypothetical protein